jgi:hypothetical protein
MAWGLATAVGELNDALQRWDFGLVAYKLYETNPSVIHRFTDWKRNESILGIYYIS